MMNRVKALMLMALCAFFVLAFKLNEPTLLLFSIVYTVVLVYVHLFGKDEDWE